MDAIWSYWSAPSAPAHTARCKDQFHHLLAWAISLSTQGVVGCRKVLYTDSHGARMLADRMCLPFDEVHCILDEIPSSLKRVWVLTVMFFFGIHYQTVFFELPCFPRILSA